MNTQLLFKLITNLIPYVIGLIVGILGTITSGFCTEFFDERKQKKIKIREAAKDIQSFVVEGMHTGFRHKAKSIQSVKLRATEIEVIDEKVGEKLRVFINSWSQHRDILKYKGDTLENTKLALEFRKEAQKLGEELLKTAKEWSKKGSA